MKKYPSTPNVARSIILLSGGMDSTYAAVWAMKHTYPAVVVWFKYGQRGENFERRAANAVFNHLVREYKRDDTVIVIQRVQLPLIKFGLPMFEKGMPLEPGAKDPMDNPATFVPARNLIFLSYAACMAYEYGCSRIVGGWSSVDVDYPDCKEPFLHATQSAINLALGFDQHKIFIAGPVHDISKEHMIARAEAQHLNVPWHLTRSCYGDDLQPCGKCDSCIIRAKAFNANHMPDPAYGKVQWQVMKGKLFEMAMNGRVFNDEEDNHGPG